MRFFGWDFAINNSAIVEWFPDGSTELVVEWNKGPSTGNLHRTTKFLKERFQDFQEYRDHPRSWEPYILALDWSPQEIYYAGNKKSMAVKAFLCGAIFECILRDEGGVPLMVPPSVIRHLLHLKGNEKKKVVHSTWLRYYPCELRDDALDAAILGWSSQYFSDQYHRG